MPAASAIFGTIPGDGGAFPVSHFGLERISCCQAMLQHETGNERAASIRWHPCALPGEQDGACGVIEGGRGASEYWVPHWRQMKQGMTGAFAWGFGDAA